MNAQQVTLESVATRWPRLLAACQWVAILSPAEAATALYAVATGSDFGSEAVNHFGGAHAVVNAAARASTRRFLNWRRAKPWWSGT
jgi:hypothetical protein